MGGVRVTREEKIAEAQKLYEAGEVYRQIGEHFGVTPATVWRWLHPEAVKAINRRDNARRGPEKREWEDRNRASCEDCGGPLAMGSSNPSHMGPSGKCSKCWRLSEAERIDSCSRRIEAWWHQGLTLREIAERLGKKPEAMSVEINRLRKRGYRLPYRRMNKKRAMRFPDQLPS